MCSRLNRFSMLELIAAIVMLAAIMTVFLSMLGSYRKAQAVAARESRAILVLENVLVQAEGMDKPSVSDLKELLKREYEATQFPRKHTTTPHVREKDGSAILMILDAKRERPLASMEVPYAK